MCFVVCLVCLVVLTKSGGRGPCTDLQLTDGLSMLHAHCCCIAYPACRTAQFAVRMEAASCGALLHVCLPLLYVEVWQVVDGVCTSPVLACSAQL